jgi:hypothetical protein
LIPPANY